MGGVICRHCCSGACCKHNKGYCQLVEGARSCPVKSTPPIVLISRRTSPHPIPRARWCGADGGEPTAGPRPGARLPRALYDGIQGLPQGSSACPACAVSRQPCNRRSPSTTGATPGRSRRVPSLWSAVTRRTRCSPYSTTATRWLCSASLRICETTSPPLFRFLFDPRSTPSTGAPSRHSRPPASTARSVRVIARAAVRTHSPSSPASRASVSSADRGPHGALARSFCAESATPAAGYTLAVPRFGTVPGRISANGRCQFLAETCEAPQSGVLRCWALDILVPVTAGTIQG